MGKGEGRQDLEVKEILCFKCTTGNRTHYIQILLCRTAIKLAK